MSSWVVLASTAGTVAIGSSAIGIATLAVAVRSQSRSSLRLMNETLRARSSQRTALHVLADDLETRIETEPDAPVPEVIQRTWGDLEHAPQDIQNIWRTNRLSPATKLQLVKIYIDTLESDDRVPRQRRA